MFGDPQQQQSYEDDEVNLMMIVTFFSSLALFLFIKKSTTIRPSAWELIAKFCASSDAVECDYGRRFALVVVQCLMRGGVTISLAPETRAGWYGLCVVTSGNSLSKPLWLKRSGTSGDAGEDFVKFLARLLDSLQANSATKQALQTSSTHSAAVGSKRSADNMMNDDNNSEDRKSVV